MMVSSPKNIKEYSKKCPGLQDLNNEEANFYSKEDIYKWAK